MTDPWSKSKTSRNGDVLIDVLGQSVCVFNPIFIDPLTKQNTAADRVLNALRLVDAIEVLRADEGESIEIFCTNPDGTGPDNCAIEAIGYWTDYANRRFEGPTLLDALQAAVAARKQAEKEKA